MLRKRSSRPKSAPAAFIPPCKPIVADRPPSGPGWVHELKHDGYRLQVHIRDGHARLYTMNGNDWSDSLEEAATGAEAAASLHRNRVNLLCLSWKSPPSSDCKNDCDCDAAQDTHGRSPLSCSGELALID